MPVKTAADAAALSDAPDRVASPPAVEARRPPVPMSLSRRVLFLADRYRKWVFGFILLLYIAGFNGKWRLEPDSALYLTIGRNLVEGHRYTYLGKDHRLAYPGVPLLFAGIFKLFGTDRLLPHLAAMWLLGLAALGLVYRLFLLHAGRPTAVLMTLGVALSRVFYRYSFELLSDLPFLVGVLAFFVGYEAIFYRRSLNAGEESRSPARAAWYDGILLVLGLGMAVAARPAMWALVFAAALAMVWSFVRGRALWGHIAVAAMVAAAVGLFYLQDPRQARQDPNTMGPGYAEEDQLYQLGGEQVKKMAANAISRLPPTLEIGLARASFGTSVVPGLNMVLAGIVAVSGLLLVRTRPLWGMWVLATLLMVTQVPKPLDRYFLPTVPVLVFAWWRFVCWAEGKFSGRAAKLTFLLLFGLGGIPNALELLGFIYEQRQVPFAMTYKKGRFASANDIAEMLQRKTPASAAVKDAKTTWVLVPEKFGRIMTFLSHRYCIEPDLYTALDPKTQNVFVLNPTEAEKPEGEPKRPPVKKWLEEKGCLISPDVIDLIPNKEPGTVLPWTLHRAVPREPAVLPPVIPPVPATQPG